MKNSKYERLFFLDSLRSFLILGVALLHAIQIYNPQKTWLIYSDNTNVIAGYLITLLGLLLMPTFFMIAGYSSVISFRHKHNFFKRIARLLIPLLTIVCSLNILQAWLLVQFGWKDYTINSYIKNGDWIQHVWFLINLISYTIVSMIIVRYFKEQTRLIINKVINKLQTKSMYLILFFMPLISILLLVLFKIIPNGWIGINITQIIAYIPYYFFGILLIFNKKLLKIFSSTSIIIDLLIITVSLLIIKSLENYHNLEYRLIYFYVKYLGTWFMASLAFTIFYKYFNFKSKLIFKISDASYTIYLVHHILVVVFGMLIIYIKLNFYVGICVVFFFSSFLSYFFHRKIVLKYKFLQFCLNGKLI